MLRIISVVLCALVVFIAGAGSASAEAAPAPTPTPSPSASPSPSQSATSNAKATASPSAPASSSPVPSATPTTGPSWTSVPWSSPTPKPQLSPLQAADQTITRVYGDWPEERARLGAAIKGTECLNGTYPCWRKYADGGIYVLNNWQDTYIVSGTIYAKWTAAGGMQGPTLGLPASSMSCDEPLRCKQTFQSGAIYSTPRTGAVIFAGRPWLQLRDSNELGWPTADATCLVGPSCFQNFELGVLRYSDGWISGKLSGIIYDYAKTRATALGNVNGFPECTDQGCTQPFQRGTVHSSTVTGTYTMTGAINDQYTSYPDLALGWPMSEEQCGLARGGCMQQFQTGRIYWAPAVGAWMIRGGILSKWMSMGAENSSLGYPVFFELCHTGVCYTKFQSGGLLVWSPASGTQQTAGAIGAKYVKYSGYLGGPVSSSETCGLRAGACFQQFARGKMYWVPGLGTWPIRGGIEAMWRSNGAENGRLGYPNGPEFCRLDGAGCHQDFERGRLVWGIGTDGPGGAFAP